MEPETLERFGLTAVRARTRLTAIMQRGATPVDAEELSVRDRARIAPRFGAGLAAGLLVLAALGRLGPAPSFSPRGRGRGCRAGGGRCCRGSAGSPRPRPSACGWPPDGGSRARRWCWRVALAATSRLAAPRRARCGRCPRSRRCSGVAGLAPLFVGIAALAPTAGRRAGLAAAGFLWLALAEVLTGARAALRRWPTAPWRARAGRARRTTRAGRRCLPAGVLAGAGARPRVGCVRRSCCRCSCAAAGRRSTCWPRAPGSAGLVAAHDALGHLLAAGADPRARARRRGRRRAGRLGGRHGRRC